MDTLPSPKYYNLRTTCNSHGWKELAPFIWDDEACTLGATVSVSGEAVDLTIEQQKSDKICSALSVTISPLGKHPFPFPRRLSLLGEHESQFSPERLSTLSLSAPVWIRRFSGSLPSQSFTFYHLARSAPLRPKGYLQGS
jgi:hypothetical protein